MTSLFVTTANLSLVKNYLMLDGRPVSNSQFEKEQHEAFELSVLVDTLKTADFKGKSPDSYEDILKKAQQTVERATQTNYSVQVEPPVRPLADKLKEEALLWMKYESDKENAEQLNGFMQKFNTINQFEEIGLYFEQGTPRKLTKIFTIEEIKELALQYLKLSSVR